VVLEDPEHTIAAWNERQALRAPMIFSPTIGAAPPIAGPVKRAEETEQQIRWCRNGSPDLTVKGCTAVLESGACQTLMCTWALNKRGQAYYHLRDYDHAIADFSQVLTTSRTDRT
jgi:hypothetical protein